MAIVSLTDARRLDQRITVQRKVKGSQNPVSGTVAYVWTTFATLWACVDAIKANERYDAEQTLAGRDYTVWIRWRGDISANDRIVWNGQNLNITSVPDQQKRGRFLALFCESGVNEG
jgi:SPP1 family predicted phage head-tail adaptor